jgi:hypothetical protein
MPEKKIVERARRDKRQGKAPSTQAGEFVREEIEHVREGKHGARSTKQAIAIGLSKARRAGVDLPPPGEGTSRATKRKAAQDEKASRRGRKPSAKRSRATKKALSKQAKSAARRRGAKARSAAARKAVATKGARKRSAAAKKAARTRAARG